MIVDLVRSNQSNLLDEQIIVLDLSSCPIDLGLNEKKESTVVNRRMVSDRAG